MPKRDRNHELETASQRAFEAALPDSVVVRPVSDDYGIDREVEVFVDGETTGLTFKVQLKATDKSGTSRRIKRDHLEYWRSLDVPVLLVTYEAKTRTLRGRWVHSIGADGPDTGAQTLTVSMDPGITIEDAWAARLASDLRLIRAVRKGEIPNPTPVRIEAGEGPISASQVAAALFNLSRRTPARMTFANGDNEAALTVSFAAQRAQAALPLQIATSSLHLAEGVLSNIDARQVAELSMILCAAAVAPLNQDVARQWLLSVDPSGPWWAVPEFAECLLPVLAHRDSAAHLLQIHAGLISEDTDMADFYMLPLTDLVRGVEPKAFSAYSTRVRDQIGPTWDGGRLAFNLSSLHRLRRDHDGALELLDLAVERAPRYAEDPLYHRYYGACLWEVGRYEESAQTYQRGLDFGFDEYELLPLLADSLMYAGHYQHARDVLARWKARETVADKAGVIRLAILDHILGVVGVTDQERASEQRVTEALDQAGSQGPLDRTSLLGVLRDLDALHPLPWRILAGLEAGQVYFEAALIGAFMLTREPDAWVIAMAGALETGAAEALLRSIIDQARYSCGEGFYDAVMEFASEQEDEQATYLRELISAAYASDPEVLSNRIRAVDPSQVQWALEIAKYPAM